MNDTTKARKFIKDNIDTMSRKEMLKKLYVITNLSKSTLQNLIKERVGLEHVAEEKIERKDGRKAKELIESLIDEKSEAEIINYIVENTRLNELSAEAIYLYVKKEREDKPKKIIKKEKVEEIKYKGIKRQFFRFDVSNLWRNV
ncbi:hypothetical protein [uncultured Clostridium sp.]|uniref:hypothetical protein n=1 Tax=uncultured Clostridium sp. TaxID=59620 RepID=UPI00280BE171|nr:hypothetical protein [uncultured Clostridium sp.]